jgi:hypothetical protein
MNDTKVCSYCHTTLPRTPEFFYRYKNGRDGLDNRCKSCDNTKTKNRDKVKVKKYKDGPCVDCGIQYPACAMSFDYLDPDKKTLDHSQLMRRNKAVMEEELKHCVLVCLNCHAVRAQIASSNKARLRAKP